MTGWPIALPLLVFVILWVTLLGLEASDGEAWRRAFVKAALACGAMVTLTTELLSLVGALTGFGLALCWGLALLAAGAACWRTQAPARVLSWARNNVERVPAVDLAVLAGLALIVILLGLVAWVSPPNTTDSLLYHMSRVVHWAQNASLRHYPTAYEHQLWFPPWAETAILSLRLLWGNDQPAGLVQWLSFVGSLILVAGIAGELGAGRRGRFLATAFCAGIPMAVLQATSTQNDLTAAFWLLCIVYLILLDPGRRSSLSREFVLGLAIGLGILTKTTFYLYATPFVVWHLALELRMSGWRAAALSGVTAGLVAATLNLGYWARNWMTYGTLFGSAELVRGHTALGTGGAMAVGWAQHLLSHFATPSEPLNRSMEAAFHSLTAWLPAGTSEFHLTWSWNHEDLAGSPLHLAAIALLLVVMFVWGRRPRPAHLAGYAVAGVAGFGLVTTLLSWNPYVVRLHLPFLVVMAPFVGAAAASRLRPAGLAAFSAALLLAALPWVLLNQTRPVIGLRPRTAIVSVFRAEKVDILFANWLTERDDFIAATRALQATGCRQVGLRLDSHDLEYPYWWLLQAPQSGIRLESIDPYPHLARYVDPNFRPCAIVCTVCDHTATQHGLELEGSFGGIDLHLEGGASPEATP